MDVNPPLRSDVLKAASSSPFLSCPVAVDARGLREFNLVNPKVWAYRLIQYLDLSNLGFEDTEVLIQYLHALGMCH